MVMLMTADCIIGSRLFDPLPLAVLKQAKRLRQQVICSAKLRLNALRNTVNTCTVYGMRRLRQSAHCFIRLPQ